MEPTGHVKVRYLALLTFQVFPPLVQERVAPAKFRLTPTCTGALYLHLERQGFTALFGNARYAFSSFYPITQIQHNLPTQQA
jgi:hypothetical protein